MSDHIARVARRSWEAYAATDHLPWDACVTPDAIEGYHSESTGWTTAANTGRARAALTFARTASATGPEQPDMDFHPQVLGPITNQHQVAVYGNSNGYHQIFTAPYVDIRYRGHVGPGPLGPLRALLRAVSTTSSGLVAGARRAGRHDERNPEKVRLHFASGLAYGIYPCVGAMGIWSSSTRRLPAVRAGHRGAGPSRAGSRLAPRPARPTPRHRAHGSHAEGELHLKARQHSDEAVEATVRST